MMIAASLCHQLAWVGSAGESAEGGFAKREIQSGYFLGERAVSCRKPVGSAQWAARWICLCLVLGGWAPRIALLLMMLHHDQIVALR